MVLRRLEEVDSNSHSVERLCSLGFILKYGVCPRLGNSTHPFFFKFPVSFVSILRNARLAAKAKKWRPRTADPNGIGIKIGSTTFLGGHAFTSFLLGRTRIEEERGTTLLTHRVTQIEVEDFSIDV